jgi:hypothetical protein
MTVNKQMNVGRSNKRYKEQVEGLKKQVEDLKTLLASYVKKNIGEDIKENIETQIKVTEKNIERLENQTQPNVGASSAGNEEPEKIEKKEYGNSEESDKHNSDTSIDDTSELKIKDYNEKGGNEPMIKNKKTKKETEQEEEDDEETFICGECQTKMNLEQFEDARGICPECGAEWN